MQLPAVLCPLGAEIMKLRVGNCLSPGPLRKTLHRLPTHHERAQAAHAARRPAGGGNGPPSVRPGAATASRFCSRSQVGSLLVSDQGQHAMPRRGRRCGLHHQPPGSSARIPTTVPPMFYNAPAPPPYCRPFLPGADPASLRHTLLPFSTLTERPALLIYDARPAGEGEGEGGQPREANPIAARLTAGLK